MRKIAGYNWDVFFSSLCTLFASQLMRMCIQVQCKFGMCIASDVDDFFSLRFHRADALFPAANCAPQSELRLFSHLRDRSSPENHLGYDIWVSAKIFLLF